MVTSTIACQCKKLFHRSKGILTLVAKIYDKILSFKHGHTDSILDVYGKDLKYLGSL